VFAEAISVPVTPGWEDGWRAFHHPVRAGGLWIGPPWGEAPAGEPTVVIDPGQAFGTGAHPTTRACIELLAAERPASILDAGCGSGVVAIAATRLGHGPVLAVDTDPVAVAAARANAARNGADVEVRLCDVVSDPLPAHEVLVANIELEAVEALLARRSAARAITSGYLAHERVRVPRWRAVRALEVDGWAAELLERI
jgi:ribosomal protein L11 methyltransferase